MPRDHPLASSVINVGLGATNVEPADESVVH
jgi:hypothetical protein